MKYADIAGERRVPAPTLRGTCVLCGKQMVAKCGLKVAWHWAHLGVRHCDPWWENETPWHKRWKSHFPEPWHEVVRFDSTTGEKHIADVKTPGGVVLEFQNSPMGLAELRAREAFYGDMVWVVNGTKFVDHFEIVRSPAPDPSSELAKDLVITVLPAHLSSWLFFRRSEAPDHDFDGPQESRRLFQIHGFAEIEEAVRASRERHHFFHWRRPREVWFEAQNPVFLDFGEDLLWELVRYDNHVPWCVQWHSKSEFVKDHGGVWDCRYEEDVNAGEPSEP